MENRLATDRGLLNPGLPDPPNATPARSRSSGIGHTGTRTAARIDAALHPAGSHRPGDRRSKPEKIEIKQYCQLTTEQHVAVSGRRRLYDGKTENTEAGSAARQRATRWPSFKQVCKTTRPAFAARSLPVGRRLGRHPASRSTRTLAEGTGCCVLPSHRVRAAGRTLAARFGQPPETCYLHGGNFERRDEMVTARPFFCCR